MFARRVQSRQSFALPLQQSSNSVPISLHTRIFSARFPFVCVTSFGFLPFVRDNKAREAQLPRLLTRLTEAFRAAGGRLVHTLAGWQNPGISVDNIDRVLEAWSAVAAFVMVGERKGRKVALVRCRCKDKK